MIYENSLHGLSFKTGDIICTTDVNLEIEAGEFWRFLGRILPGEVDHVAIYVGPDGRCVEAGARGVVTFDLDGDTWNSRTMIQQRGRIFDQFYGVAYPLAGRGLSTDQEQRIREGVAAYCLLQAQTKKPYNLNFLDADTEMAFYCSQLAYKAYLAHGINLNSGRGVPNLPGTSEIVFTQEVWSACHHRRPAGIP
jgi:hypothetical protein